ncbi:hypothetical protein PL11201_690118 [Planktothrix sp. PCC 11201]|nr:hypothetical protein PL11201_690118 [Planktothrix sp. PCC 11201]
MNGFPIPYFNIKQPVKYDRIKSVISGEYLCQKQQQKNLRLFR